MQYVQSTIYPIYISPVSWLYCIVLILILSVCDRSGPSNSSHQTFDSFGFSCCRSYKYQQRGKAIAERERKAKPNTDSR